MQGGCLCKQVTYEVDAIDLIKFCHCRTCQLAQGAPYSAGGLVKRENFRWLTGEHLLKAYESSPGKKRYFCSNCGTPLLGNKASLPYVALRVVTLDEDPNIRPSEHIWLQDDCPWTQDNEALPRFDTTPNP